MLKIATRNRFILRGIIVIFTFILTVFISHDYINLNLTYTKRIFIYLTLKITLDKSNFFLNFRPSNRHHIVYNTYVYIHSGIEYNIKMI